MSSHKQRKVFFIVGFPRSGTKLLRNILENHEKVFIAHELLFLPRMLEKWDQYGALSDRRNFKKMYRDIMSTFYFSQRVHSGAELLSETAWYDACETFDPIDVLLPVIRYETRAPNQDDLLLGEKSPNYTIHLGRIKRAIPEAKFIHIVRDGRDAALSAQKVWRKNIYRFIQRWADGMKRLNEDIAHLPQEDVLEVRYEELVTNPEEILVSISAFLGFTYDAKLLQLTKSPENLGDARGAKQIIGDNVGKYRTHLSTKEIDRLDSLAHEPLQHYGYSVGPCRSRSRLAAITMGWYLICDVLNRFAFDLQEGEGVIFSAKSLVSRVRTRM